MRRTAAVLYFTGAMSTLHFASHLVPTGISLVNLVAGNYDEQHSQVAGGTHSCQSDNCAHTYGTSTSWTERATEISHEIVHNPWANGAMGLAGLLSFAGIFWDRRQHREQDREMAKLRSENDLYRTLLNNNGIAYD